MSEHYIISDESLIDLLDALDGFQDKMDKLVEEYPMYKYTMQVKKDDYHGWKATIKVDKDEEDKQEI